MSWTIRRFMRRVRIRMGVPWAMRGFLVAWAQKEGGAVFNGCHFNPLNTTEPWNGAPNCGPSTTVKAYRSPKDGIDATVATMRFPAYAGIFEHLRRKDPRGAAEALQRSGWCGGPNAPCPGYGEEVLHIFQGGSWRFYQRHRMR